MEFDMERGIEAKFVKQGIYNLRNRFEILKANYKASQ